VSDQGPEDPFRNVPFLSDIAKMIQGQGAFSWEAARQFAIAVASEGESEPNVDPIARIELEQLIRVAELHVSQATGLIPSGTGRPLEALPVTRALWAHQTIEAYRPLFEGLAAALSSGEDEEDASGDPSADFFGGLMKMISPMMLGVTAGSMVGHLAQRAFGQYDLPIPRAESHQLLIVPSNLDRFASDWSLPISDLRLWVCLSEVTTHAVLNVPHVRAEMTELMRGFVSGYRPDPRALEDRLGGFDIGDPQSMTGLQSAFADPEVLLGASRSPEQHALLPRLDALVALVIGVTDHVMDTVGASVLTSYGMLTEALRRRRVSRLLGLTLTREQVQRGSQFVNGVVERAGADGLSRLWVSARELPTPAEIDAPGLWLARIDL
jgi:putative hydrolase